MPEGLFCRTEEVLTVDENHGPERRIQVSSDKKITPPEAVAGVSSGEQVKQN
jgi:hypothetical protein